MTDVTVTFRCSICAETRRAEPVDIAVDGLTLTMVCVVCGTGRSYEVDAATVWRVRAGRAAWLCRWADAMGAVETPADLVGVVGDA